VIEGKESEFSFVEDGKESIAQRLRALIGERSVRETAQDWGLSFSTLNNYLTRGTAPSLNVAIKIANVENVSVEWLATGVGRQTTSHKVDVAASEPNEFLRTTWMAAFELMNKSEAEALLRMIISGGARGLIKLAEHEASLEEVFMLLSPELKARAIELVDAHVEAKKGASEGSELSNTASPASDQRQAS
jgi:transcriptional regulator with XRE-family HTH domain